MKTITLYEFNELNEDAKKTALRQVKERHFEEEEASAIYMADCAMSNIMVAARVKEVSNEFIDLDPYDKIKDKSDKERFRKFLDRYKSSNSGTKNITDKIVLNYQYNEEMTYLDNVSIILRRIRIEVLNYFMDKWCGDEFVVAYINAINAYFSEDGNIINL